MNKKIILFSAAISLILFNSVFAETVLLKSGGKVKGKIVQKTDFYIQLIPNGESVKLTYFFSEIEKINEDNGMPANQANSAAVNTAVPAVVSSEGSTAENPGNRDKEEAVGHCEKGLKFLSDKQYTNAKSEFEQALKLNPDFFEAQQGMGVSSYFAGQYEEAVNYFSKALKLKPEEARVYCGLGSSYIGMNQPQKALGYLEKAIKLNISYAEAYFQMGKAYYDLREYSKARESFLKARNLFGEGKQRSVIPARTQEIDKYLNKIPF